MTLSVGAFFDLSQAFDCADRDAAGNCNHMKER
jgi:hypothetical protein